jgi:hypothetical protein
MSSAQNPVNWCDEAFAAQVSSWKGLLSRVTDKDVRAMCHKELLAISIHKLSAALLVLGKTQGCVSMPGLAIALWVYACAPGSEAQKAACADVRAAQEVTVAEISQKGGNRAMLDLCKDGVSQLLDILVRID